MKNVAHVVDSEFEEEIEIIPCFKDEID